MTNQSERALYESLKSGLQSKQYVVIGTKNYFTGISKGLWEITKWCLIALFISCVWLIELVTDIIWGIAMFFWFCLTKIWQFCVWHDNHATKKQIHVLNSSYCIIVGIMLACLGTKAYDNLKHDAKNTHQAYAYASTLKSKLDSQVSLVKIGNEVLAGERRITPIQSDGPMGTMIKSESERMGCEIQIVFLDSYFSAVRTIESSGRIHAAHSRSKAYGFYAFKPASLVDTASYGVKYTKANWGYTPEWMDQIIQTDGQGVVLREDQWKVLVLLHAIMRTGSDEYMKSAFCNGNRESAKTVYKRFHHTKPDAATLKLVDKQFGYKWPTQAFASKAIVLASN